MGAPMWKALFAGLLLWSCGAGSAMAASPPERSPLDRYLAARDRHVADIERAAPTLDPKSLSGREERALADLEKQLKAIIGPVSITGLAPEGKINLETLLREQGFGKLDGVVFTAPDASTTVVATTTGLLKSWLKAHENWWPDSPRMPQDIKRALATSAFYTQAISTDASVAIYADIPVAAPADAAPATALLVIRRQDVVPVMPNEILVSAVRGTRVFIASQPVAATISPIPACAAVLQRFQKKADAAFAAYRASKQQDEKRFEEYVKLGDDGDAAFRRCFAERFKDESAFASVTRQAQSLFDRLPAE